MKPTLCTGDLYYVKRKDAYYLYKILKVEEAMPPVWHLLAYGPIEEVPVLANVSTYPVFVRHFTRVALPPEEFVYLGHQKVSQRELKPYYYHLKLHDFERFLEESGKTMEEVIDRAAFFLQRGIDYVGNDQWIEAILEFSRALRQYPFLQEAFVNRGFCYLELKQWELAYEDLEIAFALEPEQSDLLPYLVGTLLELNRPAEAQQYLDLIPYEELFAEHRLMFQGYIDLALNRFDTALDAFLEALYRTDKDPQYYYNLACFYAVKGEPYAAIEWLDLALKRGYSDIEYLRQDKDLDSLKGLAAFQTIMLNGEC